MSGEWGGVQGCKWATANSLKWAIADIRKAGRFEEHQREHRKTTSTSSGTANKRAASLFTIALDIAMAGAEPLILVVIGGSARQKSTTAKRTRQRVGGPS